MQYEILGFDQKKVIEAELDITDLFILNYIIQSNGNPTMEHIVKDGVSYVWIYHLIFLQDLPILPISEGTFRNRLCELKRKGLIVSETVKLIKGSKSYYSVTELTMSFKNDVRRNFKMTPDNIDISKDISSISSNIKSNTSNQLNIIQDNNINNKEDTYNKEDVEKFVADYNSICKSLPKCKRMTVGRSKGIIKILKKFSYEEILEVFNTLENSDFCKGNNDRGWKASIDFVLSEEKFVRVLEGRYSNKARRNNFEKISQGEKYRVSAEEREEMRKAVERGDLEVY